MHPILLKLQGGDRRSIGRSDEVVAEVLADPRLFRVLFSGLHAEDPLVRIRSADALEKITAKRPQLLRPYTRRLIHDVAASDEKEVRWHVAQMLPRLDLDRQERKTVLRVLRAYLDDRSSIVRTFAMQALADFARVSTTLVPAVRRNISELAATGTPAMRARGRRLLAELGEARGDSGPAGPQRSTRPRGKIAGHTASR
jgi:HEAT repeat protein